MTITLVVAFAQKKIENYLYVNGETFQKINEHLKKIDENYDPLTII